MNTERTATVRSLSGRIISKSLADLMVGLDQNEILEPGAPGFVDAADPFRVRVCRTNRQRNGVAPRRSQLLRSRTLLSTRCKWG